MFSQCREPRDSLALMQVSSLMEAAGDVVFQLDGQGNILHASQRTLSLLGKQQEVIGQPLTALFLDADRPAIGEIIVRARTQGDILKTNARLKIRDGELWVELQLGAYPAPDDKVGLLAIGRDISGQQAAEAQLRRLAAYDALTGLPNRSLLCERARLEIERARGAGSGFSVIALDLDGFKKVNDALGHEIGDALLKVAANRLAETLRDGDTLARVGGDEFMAVLPDVVAEAEIQAVARRMIASMQLPFDIDGHILYVGTSLGAAVFPEHGETDVKLLAHADTAMCRAKETGKARCVVYSHEKFTLPDHDVSMEAAMFQAVREGEFLLHYQPIVDAGSRRVMGFEALMRWHRPGIGMISPVQFIPMAENNGLINLLGAWALKTACVQVKRFSEAAGRPLYVSVNVSPRQFRNDQFLAVMDEALTLSGLDGRQLLLEITEGILMFDPEHAERLLTAIRARDVCIAIDDFGTGYSSLAYLKRFPISTLKIDRAFIKDLPASVKDAAICNVVLSLASHLKLNTVAEGVESEEQLRFLAEHGCDLIQGYLTGRPLMAEHALDLLKHGAPLPCPAAA
jgi:diguanylate cyclase (GGDEF)-like protein/PAS domain S-box-containing protein